MMASPLPVHHCNIHSVYDNYHSCDCDSISDNWSVTMCLCQIQLVSVTICITVPIGRTGHYSLRDNHCDMYSVCGTATLRVCLQCNHSHGHRASSCVCQDHSLRYVSISCNLLSFADRFKAVGVVDASPEQCYKYVDPKPEGKRCKWDKAIKGLEIIEYLKKDDPVRRALYS